MAAVLLLWDTNMAAVTSCENTLLSYSYVSIILPFCAAGDFFMGLRTFKPASHRPRIFEEVPTYHCSKKDEPSIQKHLTLHQPVRKFSKSN